MCLDFSFGESEKCKKPQKIRCIIYLIVFSGVVALTSDNRSGLPPDKLNEYELRTIIKL